MEEPEFRRARQLQTVAFVDVAELRLFVGRIVKRRREMRFASLARINALPRFRRKPCANRPIIGP